MLNSIDLQYKIAKRQQQDLFRKRFVIFDKKNNYIVIDNQALLNFTSNDYLGLSSHPKIKQAFIQALEKYGFGSTASACVSGYYTPHQMLEEKFSEYLNREKALLFPSGYMANLGVINTFVKRQDTIATDKEIHASLLDAITLSRAKQIRFAHNNVGHLEMLLKDHAPVKAIVTEGCFSMSGELAPLPQLSTLAQKNKSMLIVDDAHGIGVLGDNGLGITEHAGLASEKITCLVTPLGKAFASLGAIVSGKTLMIEYLIQFARTYCYTTALPPAIAAATLSALVLIQTENWRRETLKDLIQFFIKESYARDLPLMAADMSPIKTFLFGENQLVLTLQAKLKEKGFFVAAIRPPSVPKHTARLRISLNCLHQKKEILFLLDLLADFYAAIK